MQPCRWLTYIVFLSIPVLSLVQFSLYVALLFPNLRQLVGCVSFRQSVVSETHLMASNFRRVWHRFYDISRLLFDLSTTVVAAAAASPIDSWRSIEQEEGGKLCPAWPVKIRHRRVPLARSAWTCRLGQHAVTAFGWSPVHEQRPFGTRVQLTTALLIVVHPAQMHAKLPDATRQERSNCSWEAIVICTRDAHM